MIPTSEIFTTITRTSTLACQVAFFAKRRFCLSQRNKSHRLFTDILLTGNYPFLSVASSRLSPRLLLVVRPSVLLPKTNSHTFIYSQRRHPTRLPLSRRLWKNKPLWVGENMGVSTLIGCLYVQWVLMSTFDSIRLNLGFVKTQLYSRR